MTAIQHTARTALVTPKECDVTTSQHLCHVRRTCDASSLPLRHWMFAVPRPVSTVTEICSVGSRSRSRPLPLSGSQTRRWHLSQLATDSPAYNDLITIRKAGPLDV